MRSYQQGTRGTEVAKLRLKGWPAVAAIVVVAVFLGYRAVSARSALEGQQGERLRQHLQGRYTAAALPSLRSAQGDALPGQVDAVTSFDKIRFTDVGVKGTGKEVVVRVTISVAGKPPPDGKAVRYYRMRHQAIGGWKVVREVGALSWYLNLF